MSRSRYKEYLPITGLAEFNKLSAKLIFGADRYCSVGLIYPFPPVGDFYGSTAELLPFVIFMCRTINCEFLVLKTNYIKYLPTWLPVVFISVLCTSEN